MYTHPLFHAFNVAHLIVERAMCTTSNELYVNYDGTMGWEVRRSFYSKSGDTWHDVFGRMGM